jgi:hypothetical protein
MPVEISPLRRLKNPHPKNVSSAPFPHISLVLRNGPERLPGRVWGDTNLFVSASPCTGNGSRGDGENQKLIKLRFHWTK